MPGRIPQSFINDLIAKIDIVDVVGERVDLKKAGKNYNGLCPFHNEKTPSFTVSPDKQFFHCFGCQESGTAIGFVMLHDRLTFVEAIESLAASVGMSVPREAGSSRQEISANNKSIEAIAKATDFYKQQLRISTAAKKYLQGRGITGELARDYQLGYAPSGWQTLENGLEGVGLEALVNAGLVSEGKNKKHYDRFRNRVVFPIRNVKGQTIGFGGRSIGDDDGPKYLNSPETELFKKGEELYGLYEARKSNSRLHKIIVVEGYMDVLSLAQSGLTNVVATLGTATNETHFYKLFKYTDEVVLCFDGDGAGRQAGWKALERALPALSDQKQIKLIFVPEGEDPDTLVRKKGAEHFNQQIKNAISGLDYLLEQLSIPLNLESLDDRAKFYGLCQPYIDKMKAGILRDLFKQKIDQIVGLREQTKQTPRPKRSFSEGPKVSRLEAKLCGYLLKYPDLWNQLDESFGQNELLLINRCELLGAPVKQLQKYPTLGSEELLVRLIDEPAYDYFCNLLGKPVEIEIEEMEIEFREGLRRLTLKLKEQEELDSPDKLNEVASISDLKRFVSRKKNKINKL